ncbi:uncharacterized protein N7483_007705 [Penicillium malachiteum]|uniref:uncharacterized protein n=1 Tax=Penicillium malachiteum TaxID=1324776 RepID=UPI0025466B07|nr:uncharacterized protein N7483_007705 [Penicillium malachiteum]KAJ5726348.1 hypothetical protein N7483_007705 [Penicillium malachiteum]
MDFLAPREDETCTGDKLWYSCSAGDYSGCCSSNPCTTGSCPDDDTATTSTETKTTKTTSTKTTKTDTTKSDTTKTDTTKTTSDSTTTTSTSSSLTTFHTTTSSTSTSSTTSIVQITYLHQSTTATSATSTNTSVHKSTNSSNHGAIIGGIIGSIAGLLVIVVIIFCIRRRRRSAKESYDLGFKPKPISATDTHYIGYSGSDPTTSAFYSRSPIDYRCKHFQLLSIPSITNISGLPRPLFDREASHLSSSEPTTLSKLLAPHNSSKTSLSTNTKVATSTTLTSPLPTPTLLPPRTQKPTPELPDTGLNRQRVELASYSQRELINIPLDQRIHPEPQRDKDQKPESPWVSPLLSTGFPDTSGSVDQIRSPVSRMTNDDSGPVMSMSPPLLARSTARQLITNDGVVLGANLDHYFSSSPKKGSTESQNEKKSLPKTPAKESPKQRPKPASPPQEHIMSFMNFEESICSENEDPCTPKKNESSHEGTFLNMDSPLSPNAEGLPVYEAGGIDSVADRDFKSPSRTMTMSGRRGFP